MFETLDQLIGPLSSHIVSLLSQPAKVTEDEVTLTDTKKGYIGLLNGVMASKLQGIFISERENLVLPRFCPMSTVSC
jgi:exportin-T